MTLVALWAELIPLILLTLIDPTNYWQGRDDDAREAKVKHVNRSEMAINVNLIRSMMPPATTANTGRPPVASSVGTVQG
jgi:hypothetical protein